MLSLFIKGLVIGFAIAAPAGPIGILCIQCSLHDGFQVGLMTGIGTAFANGTHGLIAGLGLGTTHPDYIHAAFLVTGIILGLAFWWLLLSGGVAFVLHRKVNSSFMRAINWISGIIIFSFGIFALITK